MTHKRSAGLLLYRQGPAGTEVLLGHMGGPFWARKDARGWSVPKGEYEPDEEPLAAARREFHEELGHPAPEGPCLSLGEHKQRSGKIVTVWAVPGDFDPATMVPGTFSMEWPRGSGRTQDFPELDRVEWCTPERARVALVAAQTVFVDRLLERLSPKGDAS